MEQIDMMMFVLNFGKSSKDFNTKSKTFNIYPESRPV